MTRQIILFILALAACVAGLRAEETVIPDNPAKAATGWEAGAWTGAAWGNSATAEVVAQGERKVVRLSFIGGDKEKAAWLQSLRAGAAPDGRIYAHVYSPDETPPAFALVLLTGPNRVWHETKPFALKPGWNALALELTKPNWKTEAANWQFEAGVGQPSDVQGVGLIVMNGQRSGWLAVEGLTADPDAATKRIAGLIEKLQSPEGDVRAQAEKDLVEAGAPAASALRSLRSHARPEVALRAGWALDKIEAKAQEEQKAREAKERESRTFEQERTRMEGLLRRLAGARTRFQQMAQEGRQEAEKARADKERLKAPSEEELAAYLKLVDQLDQLAQEIQKAVGEPPAPKAEPAAEQK